MTSLIVPWKTVSLLLSYVLLLGSQVKMDKQKHVVVIGGGLAGLSASYAALQGNAKVTLLEGEKAIGGNSAKATSGINGCRTSTQLAHGVDDDTETFFIDTVKAGHDLNNRELVSLLVHGSGDAVERLKSIGVQLDDLVVLGGHSIKRTHRIGSKDGKPVPVGFTIIRTLFDHLKKLTSSQPDRFDVRTNTLARGLVVDENGAVVGVRVKSDSAPDEEVINADAVILATGGFSNDHTNNSLLKEFANEKIAYPTTNGPFAIGSGVKMARAIGASLVDMDKVQLHPTGFVDPKSPAEGTKFLAAEALRGSGGILLNEKGQRFANELGPRDYLTKQIETFCGKDESVGHIAFLVLNDAAVDAFGRPAFGFYWNVKNFFMKVDNGEKLAEVIGIPSSQLGTTLSEYNEASKRQLDSFGKTLFPTTFAWDKPFYVAKITPVIHYTMGGIAIDNQTRVLKNDGSVLQGLYAAGEVSGGVHGGNRLGGNSLLECVVFGNVAGLEASRRTPLRMSKDL
ncbi:hypothetical protein M514_05825 [Trichuris suis]|uniref:fumarate reductase (NADH) n=1 Tax=Trichuris suis TaxID=68888 RepID=A0A085NAE4_9BILA|nr:hypothetical protein M513_05825 [Trichuris suis]KFD66440.1 hypothetical protein M514_05825 [Trichuris suis]KHJ42901.1 flavocytochrome c [Trichuris suis]